MKWGRLWTVFVGETCYWLKNNISVGIDSPGGEAEHIGFLLYWDRKASVHHISKQAQCYKLHISYRFRRRRMYWHTSYVREESLQAWMRCLAWSLPASSNTDGVLTAWFLSPCWHMQLFSAWTAEWCLRGARGCERQSVPFVTQKLWACCTERESNASGEWSKSSTWVVGEGGKGRSTWCC